MAAIRFFLIGNRDYPLMPAATARVERMAEAVIRWYNAQIEGTARWDEKLHAVQVDQTNEYAWEDPFRWGHIGVDAAGFDPWEDGVSWFALCQGFGGWAGGFTRPNAEGGYRSGQAKGGDWMLSGIEGYQVYDPETLAEKTWVPRQEPQLFGGAAHELGHAMAIGAHSEDPANLMSWGYVNFPDIRLTAEQEQNVRNTELFIPAPEPEPTSAPLLVDSLTLAPSRLNLQVGQAHPVVLQAKMSNGTQVNATTFAHYTTLNPKVAIAEQGMVAAVGPGKTGIFIRFVDHDIELAVEVR